MATSGRIPIDDEYEREHDDSRSTTSARTLASTTTKYRHENGRRYHAFREGEYWGPNDDKNNNHEGILHHLCILTLRDRLFLAPLENPQRILDLGCGTGIWGIDIADKFESADVLGVDLSPVPPGMRPDNFRTEVDDVCSPWVHPDNHFDFIHIRGLLGSVADWPDLYRQAFKHMAPGAYIEQIEYSPHIRAIDGTLTSNPCLRQFCANFVDIGIRSGKTFEIAENMAGLIREAGFVDVVEKRYKWPVGPWSSDQRLKDIGRWNLLNWEEGLEAWVLAAHTRVLKWSYAEVQEWLKEVRKALRDRGNHVYHEVRVVYARKPE